MKNTQSNEQVINWRTLSLITIFVGGIALLYFVTDLLLLIFLTYVLSAGLNPLIKFISKHLHIPRLLSIILVIALFFGGVGAVLFFSLQDLVVETSKLIEDLPRLADDIIVRFDLSDQFGINSDEDLLSELQGIIGSSSVTSNFGNGVLEFTTNIFSGALTLVTLAAITFYQLSEPEKIKNFLISFADTGHRTTTGEIIDKIEFKLGRWLIGQATLMFIIGILSYIGFTIIGIDYALPLAVISGVTNIIPVIGPIIAIIPILIVAAATASVSQTIAVAAYLLVLQQVEGNVLVPRIMKQSVGLDPIVVIIGIMLGSQLLGVLGALLAVPLSVIASILFQEWQQRRS